MKTKILKKFTIIAALLLIVLTPLLLVGCNQADTVTNNIQKEADKFNVYRKMTFVNLYTGELLYSAEGYFSVQTSYSNDYQGQQEVALVFKIGSNQYKMDYFSVDNNVAYVIEQIENTTTDPYHWNIIWYVPKPDIIGG